jgi:hypothetical protein
MAAWSDGQQSSSSIATDELCCPAVGESEGLASTTPAVQLWCRTTGIADVHPATTSSRSHRPKCNCLLRKRGNRAMSSGSPR